MPWQIDFNWYLSLQITILRQDHVEYMKGLSYLPSWSRFTGLSSTTNLVQRISQQGSQRNQLQTHEHELINNQSMESRVYIVLLLESNDWLCR